MTTIPPSRTLPVHSSSTRTIGLASVNVSGRTRILLDTIPTSAVEFQDDAQAAALDSLIELYARLPRTPSNAPLRDRACQRLRALGVSISEAAEAADRKAEALGADRAIVALREARQALVRAADRLDREGVGSYEQDECACAVATIDNALAAMGVRS